jgi:group I intron endonuclease
MEMVIYITTNLVNGSKYIGLDTHNNPRYLGSGKLLQKAVKKYGKENFKKEILEECETLEELKKRELYWIQKYNAKESKEFYNMTDTMTPTQRPHLTEEHKQNISLAKKGKKLPPVSQEAIDKRVATRKANGYTHSEKTRKKIAASNKGKSMSLSARANMSKAKAGVPRPGAIKTLLQLDRNTGEVLNEYEGFKKVAEAGFNRWAVQNALTRSKKTNKPGNAQKFSWLYKE